jgi:YD repeat-containing protein
LLEDEYFGADSKRVLTRAGWARLVNRYGLVGSEPEEQRYYGINGEPIVTNNGYHAIRNRFDQYGRIVEFTYLDPSGAPVNARRPDETFAFATLKQRYDAYGRLSEQEMFGADGSPLADSNGIHRWVRRFDERGQVLEVLWFGTQNQPIPRDR